MERELEQQIMELSNALDNHISTIKKMSILDKRKNTFKSGQAQLDKISQDLQNSLKETQAIGDQLYNKVIEGLEKHAQEIRKNPNSIKEYRDVNKKVSRIVELENPDKQLGDLTNATK